MTSWFTGAYVHGGVAGLRNNVQESFPMLPSTSSSMPRQRWSGQPFTAFGYHEEFGFGSYTEMFTTVRCTKKHSDSCDQVRRWSVYGLKVQMEPMTRTW